jgi:predicted transcriptional regulator of viral defense system
MPGPLYNRLFEVAASQYGYVTVADARALGAPVERLSTMAARGTLVHVSSGVYRFPAFPVSRLDQFMEATLWPHDGGVLSHATALDLHELCDVNPAEIHVTVGPRFRTNREVPPVLRLHRRALAERDVMTHEGLTIVTPRRAILDGIEQHLGDELIDQAIEAARGRGAIRTRDVAEIETARRSRHSEGPR